MLFCLIAFCTTFTIYCIKQQHTDRRLPVTSRVLKEWKKKVNICLLTVRESSVLFRHFTAMEGKQSGCMLAVFGDLPQGINIHGINIQVQIQTVKPK